MARNMSTPSAALNYAMSLVDLARRPTLLRNVCPWRDAFSETPDELTLMMRWILRAVALRGRGATAISARP